MKTLLVGDVDKSADSLGGSLTQGIIDSIYSSKSECTDYVVQLDKMNFCRGCFNCWLKTPGICIFDDLGREITKAYVNSDIVIIISKVRYGTYSIPVRRTLDRLMPNLLPYFRIAENGEIHHKPRYKKQPNFIFIGYSDCFDEDEKFTFRTLADANALNFCSDVYRTYICSTQTEISSIAAEIAGLLSEWMVKG